MVDKGNEIVCLSFNQTRECFAVGTQNGFKVFATAPFKETHARDLGGGIGAIEMMYRTNLIALVGGGKSPRYPTQKVMIWDDCQLKVVGELCFRNDVKAVKMKTDKIFVVQESKFFAYNVADLKLIDNQETDVNTLGLLAINTEGSQSIVAYLDKTPGSVVIKNYDTGKSLTINAHQSKLRCLELSADGTRLATASEKGTLVRVYNAETGELLSELRRGSEYAMIYALAFDPENKWLAVTSDSGTLHIFSTKGTSAQAMEESGVRNAKSKFLFMKFISNYFDSQWSFAQYRMSDVSFSRASFAPDGTSLIVITADGNYFHLEFDIEKGGECTLRKTAKIDAAAAAVDG
eukprot:TRINITY_DN8033_c0_g3_i1.p1 TRINITY_DN8033_c0_g3~~TRINITY_DN8033_c0_g3_i1.p1  ORF type:complete len:348 (+),score=78.47 TRINITY_DN8033_c0_g3_i1:58-1101(+)